MRHVPQVRRLFQSKGAVFQEVAVHMQAVDNLLDFCMLRCHTFQGKPCQDVEAFWASREEHVLVESGPCLDDFLDTAFGSRFPDLPVQQHQRPGSAS